ncbi:MAG: T9SS type A sorting domain-containing protein [Ignavibacteria bacterium]|nr:T9SS type A sorting domain-containing protein [Ignavibacteria bacterium]
MLKTTNGGANWSSLTTGITDNINSIYFLTPLTGYACGNAGKIIYTSNGGANWVEAASNVTDNLYSIYGTFCSGSSGTLLYTSNGGLNWQIGANGFLSTYYGITSLTSVNAIACGVNTIFQPLIARTTNGGVNWSYSSFYLNSNEGNLRDVYYVNSNTVFAVSNVWDGTGGISVSTNGGVNWSTQLYNDALNSIDMAGMYGFSCGAEGYALRTTDQGTSWQPTVTGLNSVLRSVDIIDSLNAYIAGDGGVILKTTNGGITSLITTSNNIPSQFSLSKNYPNPFNPSTTISFAIPLLRGVTDVAGRGVFTSIKIYGILGNEITTLINQPLTPGNYSVNWDASYFPSGIYFYRFSAGEFSQTNKTILLK